MNHAITIGVTDLSFHRITASLVRHTLMDMGFKVQRIFSPHQENFEKLTFGEIDILCSAWLPSSHGLYKANVDTVQPLIELGLHYKPYALWGVPSYIPSEDVAEISDLLKPHVIEKMAKDIQGINAGAGITRFSLKMMEQYGLNSAGYRFHTGTEEDCFTAFEQAVSNKQWLIVPLWKPQFLHHTFKIRALSEPKGLLGSIDKAVLLLRQDRKNLFTENQLAKLDALRFSNAIIAELDYQVSRDGQDIDIVTRNWLNQQ